MVLAPEAGRRPRGVRRRAGQADKAGAAKCEFGSIGFVCVGRGDGGTREREGRKGRCADGEGKDRGRDAWVEGNGRGIACFVVCVSERELGAKLRSVLLRFRVKQAKKFGKGRARRTGRARPFGECCLHTETGCSVCVCVCVCLRACVRVRKYRYTQTRRCELKADLASVLEK